MRVRSAGSSARAASSMSGGRQRASAAMTGRRISRATWRVASESAGEAIGKPGLDDVHAERVERARQRQLRRHVHREAGRLLAVAQRRVEDDDARRNRALMASVVAAAAH